MKQTLFFLFLLLTGCVTTTESNVVLAGMSKNQVIKIEGIPNEQAIQDNYELLLYLNKIHPEFPNGKADYTFIFNKNQLIEYSVENISQKDKIQVTVRLTAKQRLMRWVEQLSLPVNPSATANCMIVDKQVNCSNTK
ncbi:MULTISPECIES: hypothetical protein [Providencia]|uniref:hypothetical protein n=2 Tax=Morganellaceae TaxID=1903414 RepID=UPI0008397CD7|nr:MULTISPECIES: hypothetical protein [Providencia]MBP6122640.1 hypothetical protein [Providencia sp.]MDD9339712.1 hypothetical protein [Providencia heimbachae]NIH22290.1 hypothetical protein [Providencia heimbachae]QCJ69667.1 hypothetical protein C9446_07275 [Providencia heimbachae]